MTDFYVGDKAWSIDRFKFGDMYPSFCEYKIKEIHHIERGQRYATLQNPDLLEVNVYFDYIFRSRIEAIEGLIEYLESIK